MFEYFEFTTDRSERFYVAFRNHEKNSYYNPLTGTLCSKGFCEGKQWKSSTHLPFIVKGGIYHGNILKFGHRFFDKHGFSKKEIFNKFKEDFDFTDLQLSIIDIISYPNRECYECL